MTEAVQKMPEALDDRAFQHGGQGGEIIGFNLLAEDGEYGGEIVDSGGRFRITQPIEIGEHCRRDFRRIRIGPQSSIPDATASAPCGNY